MVSLSGFCFFFGFFLVWGCLDGDFYGCFGFWEMGLMSFDVLINGLF